MNINRFKEFEAYAAAVIHADLRLMLPRLDEPRWEVATQSVGSIDLQFGKEGSGIIAEGAVDQGVQTLFVPIAGQQLANGQPLHDQSVLVLDPGAELTIASQVAHDWCSVALPSDLFNQDAACSQDTACRADPRMTSLCSQVIDIGNEAMTRLRRLLVSLDHSFRVEPTLATSSAAQKSVQADLLAACRPIVARYAAPRLTMGRPSYPRCEIIRRIIAKIEQHEDEFLSIEDLTLVADVSERTLRNIFLEYYGLPPRRFLTVHRLHQVRASLQNADPECGRVTAIAAQYGFWHFGRFANEYRRLFGELPSNTLDRLAKP